MIARDQFHLSEQCGEGEPKIIHDLCHDFKCSCICHSPTPGVFKNDLVETHRIGLESSFRMLEQVIDTMPAYPSESMLAVAKKYLKEANYHFGELFKQKDS